MVCSKNHFMLSMFAFGVLAGSLWLCFRNENKFWNNSFNEIIIKGFFFQAVAEIRAPKHPLKCEMFWTLQPKPWGTWGKLLHVLLICTRLGWALLTAASSTFRIWHSPWGAGCAQPGQGCSCIREMLHIPSRISPGCGSCLCHPFPSLK